MDEATVKKIAPLIAQRTIFSFDLMLALSVIAAFFIVFPSLQ